MLVVWEPMLATDWFAPSTIVLGRLSDVRASQYWDKEHVVAHRIAQDARPPQPTPGCCTKSQTLWDLAAVYPAGARWSEQMPVATFVDGPVAYVVDELEAAVKSGRRH